nr:1843_t:CDS:2 [Entrophospora candida]
MTEEKQKLKEFLQASEAFTVCSLENNTSLPMSIVLQQRPLKWIHNIQDISLDHYNPLEATIRKLDDDKRNIGFYFVVPEDKFGNYPVQKFLDQNGKVKKINGLVMSKVKRYVLEIPYAALI